MAVSKWRASADLYVCQGLSTDTKPSVASGSTFYEINTGIRWVSHKGSWVEDISMIYALTQALRETRGR